MSSTWRRPSVIAIALASAVATAFLVAVALQQHLGDAPAGGDRPVPVLGDAPAFTLIDTQGHPFGSDDLAGKVYIADFFFTRCAAICPMMTAVMADVQRDLQADARFADVKLLSITVDPDNDTVEVLADYAKAYGAEPGRWHMLTGERAVIWPIVEEGFGLGLAEDPGNLAMPITHSSKFVLVDENGSIRGYYSSLEADGPDLLLRDLATLLEE